MTLRDVGEVARDAFLPWLFLSVIIGPKRTALALAVVTPLLVAGFSVLQASRHRETGALAVLGEAWTMAPLLCAYVALCALGVLAGWGLRKARGLSGDQSPFPVTRSM
jgi:hypothetical protein